MANDFALQQRLQTVGVYSQRVPGYCPAARGGVELVAEVVEGGDDLDLAKARVIGAVEDPAAFVAAYLRITVLVFPAADNSEQLPL